VFEVRVFAEDSLTGTFRIEADGTFTYPLLGELHAAGSTAGELAATIRTGLADGYLNHPQVTVFVKEYWSRMVSILGQVSHPGRYTYRAGMTLVEAIAEAGGTTDSAVLVTIRVTRTTRGVEAGFDVRFKEITQGRSSDFPLMPGDLIFVAESAIR
jgi:polysaccharide export outer membrane protein